MNIYRLVLKSDSGRVVIRTSASSELAAKLAICNAELCPMRAIISCKLVKKLW